MSVRVVYDAIPAEPEDARKARENDRAAYFVETNALRKSESYAFCSGWSAGKAWAEANKDRA